jgi:hypothetical protein
MEKVGIFYGHLAIFGQFGIYYGHLVILWKFGKIFPINKNLATLLAVRAKPDSALKG